MRTMLRALLALAATTVAALAAAAAPAAAQTLGVATAMMTDTSFVLDANRPCTDGPMAGYVSFRVSNTSGTTLTGVRVTLGGFAGDIQLAGGEAATQYVGTFPANTTRTFFWYVGYGCTIGVSTTLSVTVTDASGASNTATGRVHTVSMISSQGGGILVAGLLGPGAVVGQLIEFDIQYRFGGAQPGDTYVLQPSGKESFNAACFHLVRTQVIQTAVTAIPLGTTDDLFFVATAAQGGGQNNTATVRYYFKYLCVGASSYTQPYSSQISGRNWMFSANWGTFVGPTLPISTNPFTVAASVTPSQLPAGGAVTVTVTIGNPSSFTTAIDSIAVALPGGMTYTALAGASGVTVANSSSVPTSGAGGTIRFLGNANSTYALGAGGSLTLVFTAAVQNVAGSYVATATPYAGISAVGSASVTVVVGAPSLTLLKSVSTGAGATVDPGTELTYTLTFLNGGSVAAVDVVITDDLPAQLQLKVGSPAATLPSGVTAVVAYYDGSVWSYTPVSGGCGAPAGLDGCVTKVRWTLQSALAAAAQGTLTVGARVR